MKPLTLSLFAAILLAASPVVANWSDPNDKAQEYRLLKFYPRAHVTSYEVKNFDSAKMLIAYKTEGENPAVLDDVEGKVVRYEYEHEPTTSVLEILRNHENLLKAKGFETIISGHADKYPALNLNTEDMVGYWRWEEPGQGMIWVALRAYYNGGHDAPQSNLTIVETKAMRQTLEANAATEAKPASMADALKESGRIAVYGITFDFNKATIRPEASPVLDKVRAMLGDDATLQLVIEGHTDSVGQPTYNQKLSTDRAESVRAWLIAHGIDAARLSAQGFGDAKPVADNATEDGRSKNRRVELARR
jgi:outer membrane protein OmpA-like peptidoglycan-associated protein